MFLGMRSWFRAASIGPPWSSARGPAKRDTSGSDLYNIYYSPALASGRACGGSVSGQNGRAAGNGIGPRDGTPTPAGRRGPFEIPRGVSRARGWPGHYMVPDCRACAPPGKRRVLLAAVAVRRTVFEWQFSAVSVSYIFFQAGGRGSWRDCGRRQPDVCMLPSRAPKVEWSRGEAERVCGPYSWCCHRGHQGARGRWHPWGHAHRGPGRNAEAKCRVWRGARGA